MQSNIKEQIHASQKTPVNNAQQDISLLRLHDSRFARVLYMSAGIVALMLGALGAVLPILPTVPFVLLAAACFARGSERFHGKLLSNHIAGPIIREWCLYRSMPRRAKRWAYGVMALSFGTSILIVPAVWHQIMLIVIGSILTVFIWRVPVRDTD